MTETSEIINTESTIDSREVIARLEYLEGAERDEEEEEEFKALSAFAKEAEDYAEDWLHGAILIHSSYFTKYAQEMLEDCGEIPRDLPHYIAIDWEATAQNIRVDYTEIDFDGQAYLVR
jgi:hypothetical protein